MNENPNSLEAPGRFELPNEGFAGSAKEATDSQTPAASTDARALGGLDRPGRVGRRREWKEAAARARWGTLEQRFWDQVRKNPGPECWVWVGRRDKDGYGRLGAEGKKNMGAHRVSWLLAHGTIPAGAVICHHCDNPGCIRPDHLFVGTQRENVHDSLAKGRHGSLKQTGRKRGPYRRKAA